MTRCTTYLLLLLGLWSVLVSCGAGDRVVDWSPYYRTERTEPYGLYIFNEELEKIKPKFKDVDRLKRSVATQYNKESDEILNRSVYSPKTYLYIDEENKMNQASREAIKEIAYYGNHVFIATHNFDFEEFRDHFAFSYEQYFGLNLLDRENKETVTFSIGEKAIQAQSDRIRGLEYFNITDEEWAIPLGYFQVNNDKQKYCNFMALRYGDGLIFLHTNPEVFTNYFLLQENNSRYTEELMSHWNYREIFWFVNYAFEFDEDYSLLTYMLKQPALKTAWYLLWTLLLIAVITYAKRMQRIIPVMEPKKNYSVDYAKRLAQFHLLQKNYHGLIDKQITILLDKLRSEHRMDTSQIDDAFADRMHLVTNCRKMDAEDLVNFIKKHRVRSVAFDFDFEELRRILKKLNI